jgi:hypothetical protein
VWKGPESKACSGYGLCNTRENRGVWGKCTSFKTTSTTLNPKTRRDLLQLYSKIYGKIEVTNNEFMTWLVKGYIAEYMVTKLIGPPRQCPPRLSSQVDWRENC